MVHLQLIGTHRLIFEIMVTAVILVILVILLFIFRYLKQLNSKTQLIGKQRKISASNISREVNAMLSEYRKGLTQREIANSLGLPHHVVAQKLLEMVDKGLITREWDNDEFKYSLKQR